MEFIERLRSYYKIHVLLNTALHDLARRPALPTNSWLVTPHAEAGYTESGPRAAGDVRTVIFINWEEEDNYVNRVDFTPTFLGSDEKCEH
jgi:hypothetical protein